VRGDLEEIDTALLSVAGSQMRFAQLVDAATEDLGRCEPGEGGRPGYGILAHVGLGHALHYSGKRATPADPFGPYIGQENFDAVGRFMESHSERRAERLMKKLSARYVATAADSIPRPRVSLWVRLHESDGSFKDSVPQLGHFRLVTEGPLGGVGMSTLFGDDVEGFAPYKLFEFVPGAVIEYFTEPGGQMTVELPLKTPSGRRFVWRGAAKADEKGRVQLRVPYANPKASDRSTFKQRVDRVESLGAYKVRVGERRFRIPIDEEQVQTGATVYARKFEVLDAAGDR
jgi:hypothetical protein